jgi:hypothetical protein
VKATAVTFTALLILAVATAAAQARVLHVGPGEQYRKPCQAIAAARPGDVIEIDARGNPYRGDVCAWSTNHVTIVGVHGRAHLEAAGQSSEGKAIWVIAGSDTTIENIEFSGARVPDQNGAGIRQEGANLVKSRALRNYILPPRGRPPRIGERLFARPSLPVRTNSGTHDAHRRRHDRRRVRQLAVSQ